jgi:hypothetical protein
MGKHSAPSTRWKRMVEVGTLLLTLHVASGIRADDTTVAVQSSGPVEHLPRPEDYRLIRIGPQVVVKEDDRGNISMVDEMATTPSRGRGVVAVFTGILTAGALLALGRNELGSNVGGRVGP